ncbi:MAG: hypothetical protein ACOH1K_02510 [Rhodoglobus sp.]
MTGQRPQPHLQPRAYQRTPRKRRFPWARLWVWAGTAVAGALMIGFVAKFLG